MNEAVFVHIEAKGGLWTKFSELDAAKVMAWKKTVRESRLDLTMDSMNGRLRGEQLDQVLDAHRVLIDITEACCGEIVQGMTKPAVFLVTTADGTVIAVKGQADVLRRMDERHNLGPGAVFDLPRTGINAITVARELERWVFLHGKEHDLRMFTEWSCFCAPIRQDGQIVGYLDLSFGAEEDHLLLAAVFDLALRGIERSLREQCPQFQKENVMAQLRACGLTPRELEIGYLWLMNNSVRDIAGELYLAEGTVRLVIKKVYKKVEVSDKGGFMSRFL